jgi:predicted DCC family thiol-disulfide oxidoreductase YuxK
MMATSSSNQIEPEIVFYDGHCGFCHRSARLIVRLDRKGVFRLAPRGGQTFQSRLSEAQRAGLGETMSVLTRDGRLLTRSDSSIHILRRLGGFWRFEAALIAIIPKPLRDFGYKCIARIRHWFFPRPKDACPIMPEHLRTRFLP